MLTGINDDNDDTARLALLPLSLHIVLWLVCCICCSKASAAFLAKERKRKSGDLLEITVEILCAVVVVLLLFGLCGL